MIEVAYVTDIEGNLDYFKRWVEQSRVLTLDADKLEFVHENAYFVFGGFGIRHPFLCCQWLCP